MIVNSSLDTLTGLSLNGIWGGLKGLTGALTGDFSAYWNVMKPVVTFAEGVVRLLKLLP